MTVRQEPQQEPRSRSPLENVTVLDLTRVLSGPYATMLLGDLGATILKVEDPKGGDTTRHSAPYHNGQSHYFLAVNRNKRSLAIDLSVEAGRELLLRLCAKADVLIENFRPGTLSRLGLDEATLRRINPGLILCSISGFGQTGPLRDRIAYDVITQAMSGALSTNGEADGPPLRLSIPVGDLVGGLMAVIAILASLFGRAGGQGGRTLDVSLHDSLISTLGYLATLYSVSGKAPGRTGSRHHSIVPYGTFRTKDGWLALAVFTTRFWVKFCQAIGAPELARDLRFARTKDRMANRQELEILVERVLATRTTADWEGVMEQADVPASAILSVADAVSHPHTTARGMFPTVEHGEYGTVRIPGAPLRLGGEQVESPVPPPLLGQDTMAVLQDVLGLSALELAALQDAKVIATSSSTAPARGLAE